MPPTQKRLQGPDVSIPYIYYIEKKDKAEENVKQREDGRSSGKYRPLFLKMGVIPHAKGSAYMESGNTKLLASVLDPKELPRQSNRNPQGELQCEVKYASFATPAEKQSNVSKYEKSISISLKKSLMAAVCRHEFANFQVDVLVFVIQDDGGILSSAIMCAGLALIDGGIPMYDVITSATLGVRNNVILADPTSKEEDLCKLENAESDTGVVTVARLESMEQTTELQVIGFLSPEVLKKAVKMLVERNQYLIKLVNKVVVQNVTEKINKKKEES